MAKQSVCLTVSAYLVKTSRLAAYLWQNALQDLADGHDLADSWYGDYILEVATAVFKSGVYIARKQS